MRRPPVAAAVMCATLALGLSCAPSDASDWLVSGSFTQLAVRYGPRWAADVTTPTIIAVGQIAEDPTTSVEGVVAVRPDGSFERTWTDDVTDCTLVNPPAGSWGTVEDYEGIDPPVVWRARGTDGMPELAVMGASRPGVVYTGILADWQQVLHRNRRTTIWSGGAAWLDTGTGESAGISSGTFVGSFYAFPTMGPDTVRTDVYLEDRALVARDEEGTETARASMATSAARWLGVILFDTATGLRGWVAPHDERAFDPEGCLPSWAAACVGCEAGPPVWETPCGSDSYVGLTWRSDGTLDASDRVPLGSAVIAAEAFSGRWIVVRGTPGADHGMADLVDGASTTPLGAVTLPRYLIFPDARTPFLVSGDLDAGTASLSRIDDAGASELAFEHVHVDADGMHGFTWLADWSPSTSSGTFVSFDDGGSGRRIASGVPLGGVHRWGYDYDAGGGWLVITDADATGAGTLRHVDRTGAIITTYDDRVVAFARAPFGPSSGIAYARNGDRAGIYFTRAAPIAP